MTLTFTSSEYRLFDKRDNPGIQNKDHVHSAPLASIVEKASQIIPPAWSLKTFIARNPLEGLEHIPFAQALNVGALIFGNSNEKKVNCEMIKWCQAFYDEGQAAIPMPNKEKGFYGAWLVFSKVRQAPQA